MKVVVILTADEDKLDILVKDPGAGGAPPVANMGIPDINGMVEGKHRLGGMGLYIIRELVDEAGFIEADDEGNQFRMVIYRVGEETKPEGAAKAHPGEENKGGTAS
jgi:anti-sigma regulatory factor (Ser/Thr protein kinase)